MALSTLMQIAAVLATLTFNFQISTTEEVDSRLAEELKCLKVKPAKQCNLIVTYADPLKTVDCGMLVPESVQEAMIEPPQLNMTPAPKLAMPSGLLLMFDPDAKVSSQISYGYNHWVAVVSVDEDGLVHFKTMKMGYEKPSPKKVEEPHRYQLFVFTYDAGIPVNVDSDRALHLCRFLEKNYLGQPQASTEFTFELSNSNRVTVVTSTIVAIAAMQVSVMSLI